MNEIIIVKQLPIIEERLKDLENDIKQKTNEALSLVVTEDNFKEIKKVRATLSNEYKELENLRKKIKNDVMKPYEDFYLVYKKVTEYYCIADKELATRVTEVEQVLKFEKEKEVVAYFNEYKISLALEYEFITYETVGIKINLTDSLKKLKEKVKTFLDRVNSDINTINSMENSDEIIFEYSKTLDLANAISLIIERKKAIEEQKKVQEIAEQKRKEQEEAIKKIEENPVNLVYPPKEETQERTEEIKEYTVAFRVTATKTKLKELKQFLNNGGYKYE